MITYQTEQRKSLMLISEKQRRFRQAQDDKLFLRQADWKGPTVMQGAPWPK
jgi:hypothetical protein